MAITIIRIRLFCIAPEEPKSKELFYFDIRGRKRKLAWLGWKVVSVAGKAWEVRARGVAEEDGD